MRRGALLVGAWASGSLALHLFFLTLVPMMLAAVRGGIRMAAVAEINPAWRPQLLEKGWIWTLLAAFVPFLYALNFLTSLLTRKIRWRGISCKLVTLAQTRILSW